MQNLERLLADHRAARAAIDAHPEPIAPELETSALADAEFAILAYAPQTADEYAAWAEWLQRFFGPASGDELDADRANALLGSLLATRIHPTETHLRAGAAAARVAASGGQPDLRAAWYAFARTEATVADLACVATAAEIATAAMQDLLRAVRKSEGRSVE